MTPHSNIPLRKTLLLGLPRRLAGCYLALFLLAALSYGRLWQAGPVIAPDSHGYLEAASDLDSFRFTELHGRSPGYPLLLVLTRSTQRPGLTLVLAGLALHFTSIWLLARTLYSCGLTLPALIGFGLLLLLPPYTEWAAFVLSENLTEFALVLGFAAFVAAVRQSGSLSPIIAGLGLGYAALTRPTFQLLAPAMLIALFCLGQVVPSARLLTFRFLRLGLVILLVALVPILGVCSFNYVRFNYFGLSPTLGLNLSARTARVVERLPDRYAAQRDIFVRYRNIHLVRPGSSHLGYCYMWDAFPELVRLTGRTQLEAEKELVHLNLLLIRAAPLAYIHDVLTAISEYWMPSTTNIANMRSRLLQTIWAILHFGTTAIFALQLVVVSGLAFFLISCRMKPDAIGLGSVIQFTEILAYSLGGTTIFYTMVISCVTSHGDARYRAPTDSLIAFMIFLGIHVWRRAVQKFRRKAPRTTHWPSQCA